ncbi:MAG TPA: O-methyltransferase [Candidatus Acidoferrales bacterium]|nr:O-methyltransferase [Candidatus Acidoferrales bacterium]
MKTGRAVEVDDYLAGLFVGEDEVLAKALAASAAAGLPPIAVSAMQGKLLYLLARTCAARRILEIGTLGGYSAIWLGRALPRAGRLISLEIDAKHAAVARKNLDAAGLADVVTIHVAPALTTLDRMIEEGAEAFDLIFIDADKPNNSEYVQRALKLSRSGTLIVVDNVVRDGAVVDAKSDDPNVVGTRRCLEMMARERRLRTTVLQTVGAKGYDGFALAMVV